jgi:RNA polymerase sigma-70 factor (ECF subfamily)
MPAWLLDFFAPGQPALVGTVQRICISVSEVRHILSDPCNVLSLGCGTFPRGTLFRKGDTVVNLSEFQHDANTMPLISSEMTDQLLVSAAQSGDSHAFVELSKRHSRRILLKIYRITNNWQDAEDVYQESLMRAFIHINTFQSRASFSTWLTSIAINTALMLLRKKRSSLKFSVDTSIFDDCVGESIEPRDHRDNPEQTYARRQTEDRLTKAIQRMSPKYRKVVELHQINDLSLNEIASSLSISVGAVKSRLLRARRQLRQYVQ